MGCPVEVLVDEDTEEVKGVGGSDMLGSCEGVSVPCALYFPPSMCALFLQEGYQLCLGQISLKAILVEPL